MEFQTVLSIGNGYLITPANICLVECYVYYDDIHHDHKWGFPEYATYDSDIYPDYLKELAELGILFGWEFMCTEDFSYFAYNFPTEDSKNNLIQFKTGRRKCLPHLSKKKGEQLNNLSAVNELLFTLGHNNGQN